MSRKICFLGRKKGDDSMNVGRGRNRKGTLYRRWKGKKFDINDPIALGKGGIYLRYMVSGKTFDEALKTNDITEAKKKQLAIMRPMELASKKEALLQVEVRLKQAVEDDKDEWKARNPPLKLVEAWEAYVSAQNRPRSGPSTLSRYASHYTQFIDWMSLNFSRAIYMKDVGTREADAYADYLGSLKLSPSTYNQKLNALSLVWAVLAEKAQAQENPFSWDKKTRKGIHRQSVKAEAHQRRKRPLTVEELDEVLKHANGDYKTLIIVLVCTGQRLVDGLKLEWKSIDFEKRLIKLIPKKTSKRTGTAVYIPLFPQLEVELNKRKRVGRYVMPKLVERYDHDGPYVSKHMKKIFKDAKIETSKNTDLETGRVITDVGAHSFRHTFVTLARFSGIPDPLITQITGHSSQEMVDHYTQFSDEMVSSIAGRLLSSPKDVKTLVNKKTEEPIPAWAKEKLNEAYAIADKHFGRGGDESKTALLSLLVELGAYGSLPPKKIISKKLPAKKKQARKMSPKRPPAE